MSVRPSRSAREVDREQKLLEGHVLAGSNSPSRRSRQGIGLPSWIPRLSFVEALTDLAKNTRLPGHGWPALEPVDDRLVIKFLADPFAASGQVLTAAKAKDPALPSRLACMMIARGRRETTFR
jgi:hypothetical protein